MYLDVSAKGSSHDISCRVLVTRISTYLAGKFLSAMILHMTFYVEFWSQQFSHTSQGKSVGGFGGWFLIGGGSLSPDDVI